MFFFTLVFIAWSTQLSACISDPDLEKGLMYLASQDFGYTLVGAKPVTIEQSMSFDLIINQKKRECLFSFLERTFHKSKNFIFNRLDRHGYFELINKKTLLKQIRQYKRLNRFVRKKYTTTRAFFNALKTSDITIFEALDHDSILIAIVLGYGEENGEFFKRRAQIGEYLQKYPIVAVFPFDQHPSPYWAFPSHSTYFVEPSPIVPPPLSPQFVSLDQEWNWIKRMEWRLCDNNNPEPPYYISLPTYICRYGSESEHIHKTYLKARSRLAKLLCEKKFSEILVDEALKS